MAAGHVSPNPMVGAVLVHGNRIIGEGFHEHYGQAHAEVNCIASVQPGDLHLLPECVLYVSLEPCAHYGKTPPCADLIIEKNIPKVVVGCRDPFPAVDGKGIAKLQKSGVNVVSGVMEKQCREINKRFFTFHQAQRPYIVLKWAQTADGLMAGENGRLYISNAITNRLVHKWRAEEDAILVGVNTALLDNPQLTLRHWTGRSPVRLVLDPNLRMTGGGHLLDGSVRTMVLNTTMNAERGNVSFVKIGNADNLVSSALTALHQHQVTSVLVEGGKQLLQSFIDAGLWDEARLITNTRLSIGKGLAAPVLEKSLLVSEQRLLDDHILIYKNRILDFE